MLSIFCPYRNRPALIDDFIHDYSYLFPTAKIYIVEQADNQPFKRGQLANVIFNELLKLKEPLENIAFIDIDLRLSGFVDFEGMLERNKVVTVPFDKIELYDFKGLGKYEWTGQKSYFLEGNHLAGGITLYTKEIFEKCNGFSNVYVGWGCEDSDFLLRNPNHKHEHNTIIHLEHKRENVKKVLARNSNILQCKRSDPQKDGYRQTLVKESSCLKLSDQAYHYKVKNIGVTSDFEYMEYFNESHIRQNCVL